MTGRDNKSRTIVKCLSTVDEEHPRLMAVIIDIDGEFFICRTRGEHAMRDIGPYDSIEAAAAIARLIIPHDVQENKYYEDLMGYVAKTDSQLKQVLYLRSTFEGNYNITPFKFINR